MKRPFIVPTLKAEASLATLTLQTLSRCGAECQISTT
jgi:hypothetical protein